MNTEGSRDPHPSLGPLIERGREREGEGENRREGKVAKRLYGGLSSGHHGRRTVEKAPVEPWLQNKYDQPHHLKKKMMINSKVSKFIASFTMHRIFF